MLLLLWSGQSSFVVNLRMGVRVRLLFFCFNLPENTDTKFKKISNIEKYRTIHSRKCQIQRLFVVFSVLF